MPRFVRPLPDVVAIDRTNLSQSRQHVGSEVDACSDERSCFRTPCAVFDKDVLRVGRWYLRGRPWQVTASELRQLVSNWKRAQTQGVCIPVVWNHSHDARDRIGSVSELFLKDDVLYARVVACDPSDIGKLTHSQAEVSVEITSPWIDGSGNTYDLMLTHVGVVLLPVLSSQKPFVFVHPKGGNSMLPNPNAESSGESLEFDDRNSSTPTGAVSGIAPARVEEKPGSSLEVAIDADQYKRLTDSAQVLVNVLGIDRPIPAANDVEQFIQFLEEIATELASDIETNTDAIGPDVLQFSSRVNSAADDREMSARQASFVHQLDKLIAEGRITPARRQSMLRYAQPARYCLSLLEPFADIPRNAVLPTHAASRLAANPSPPRLPGRPPMSAARARHVAKLFRE